MRLLSLRLHHSSCVFFFLLETVPPLSLPPITITSRIPIPGPTSTVQSAMIRCHDARTFNEDVINPISTHGYIRKAVEDTGLAYDDDFERDPWLFAVDFVRFQGLVDGNGAIGVPLSAIKSRVDRVDKVALVVAIVKSCIPNGLGDMMVTLKDPTGTINASVHRQVFTEGDFGKNISLGAVLILQKVAVFSPVRSVQYLNITLNNVVKVISKDGSALVKNNSSTAEDVAPGLTGGSCDMALMPQKPSLSQGRAEGIIDCLRHKAFIMQSSHNNVVNRHTSKRICDQHGASNRTQNFVVGKKSFLLRHDVANGTKDGSVGMGIDTKSEEFGFCERQNPRGKVIGGSPLGIKQDSVAANFVDAPHDLGNISTIGCKEPRPSTLRHSLPQWTDEQLDELFAFD